MECTVVCMIINIIDVKDLDGQLTLVCQQKGAIIVIRPIIINIIAVIHLKGRLTQVSRLNESVTVTIPIVHQLNDTILLAIIVASQVIKITILDFDLEILKIDMETQNWVNKSKD